MELLKLEDYDNLKKEKIQSEMADRRWKKYKERGRKMTPKEIKQYQDRYPKSGVYGFKQNKSFPQQSTITPLQNSNTYYTNHVGK